MTLDDPQLSLGLEVPTVDEMRRYKFNGGPLNGQRREAPAYGPAYLRYHKDGLIHWYGWKSKTVYQFISTDDPGRHDG